MKKYLLILLSFYIVNTYASEGYAGHFRGTENLEAKCDGDRSFSRMVKHWGVTISTIEPDSFIGKVDPEYGLITYKGTIDENGEVKGRLQGFDTGGTRWSGFFNATIDGDELSMSVRGRYGVGGCYFRGRIQATRHLDSEESAK